MTDRVQGSVAGAPESRGKVEREDRAGEGQPGGGSYFQKSGHSRAHLYSGGLRASTGVKDPKEAGRAIPEQEKGCFGVDWSLKRVCTAPTRWPLSFPNEGEGRRLQSRR